MPAYRVAYCRLGVDDPESDLVLRVVPQATNYTPGAEVKISAWISEEPGQPVAGAEVTLWAVDEGVLALTDFETPDPHEFFYAERNLGVSSGLSLPNLMREDPAETSFHNKGYLVGGGGGRERIRRNFQPCAFWSGALRADANGKVEASFTAPDSLTRYRVIAVAQAGRDRFGHGETAFAVHKPLMIEPALPRFANLTDRVMARAVIHNQTGRSGEVLARRRC
jgi:uncharacterized protein YfaS (alpha-2-macroglobulin family)